MRQRQLEQAKAAFEKAIKISPQYPEAYYNLGSILFEQGDLEGALYLSGFHNRFESSALSVPNRIANKGKLIEERLSWFSE